MGDEKKLETTAVSGAQPRRLIQSPPHTRVGGCTATLNFTRTIEMNDDQEGAAGRSRVVWTAPLIPGLLSIRWCALRASTAAAAFERAREREPELCGGTGGRMLTMGAWWLWDEVLLVAHVAPDRDELLGRSVAAEGTWFDEQWAAQETGDLVFATCSPLIELGVRFGSQLAYAGEVRAGDVAYAANLGEVVTVAAVEARPAGRRMVESECDVACAGYPETWVRSTQLVVVERANDAAHEVMLRGAAGSSGARAVAAQRNLAALEAARGDKPAE